MGTIMWVRIFITIITGIVLSTHILGVGLAAPHNNSVPSFLMPKNQPRIYAALGDSVAAGFGLPPMSTNDQDKQCGRSSQAYPYAVAHAQDLTLIDAACSGATISDLFTKQQIDSKEISPQLDAAFAKGTPTLITITVGANDMHWIGFLRKCYSMSCGTAADTHLASTYLSVLQLKLYFVLHEIQRRSGNSPPIVIITGYYSPITKECPQASSHVTQREVTWLHSATSSLNETLRGVTAQFSFARFVPLDFNGHDICSSDPWVQGADSTAPFHPNAEGQAAIANAILKALGSVTPQ